MKVVEWEIGRVRPYEKNPRIIPEEAVERVAASIHEFGFQQPIVVDKDGVIIVGHTRLKAAEKLGLKKVPVVVADLSPEKARAYRLADNKTGEATSWDDDLLFSELTDIEADIADLDFSMLDFGFSALDLGSGDSDIGEPFEDDFDGEVPKDTDIKEGDMFQLGGHILLCGDSSKSETVRKLMGGGTVKADMMFTDPPYGVAIGDKNKTLDEVQKSGRITTNIKNDNIAQDELYRILVAAMKNAKEFSKDDAVYYVTSPQGGELGLMMMMMKDAGLPVRHVLMWEKNSATFSLGRLDYDYQHEPMFYTWAEKHHNYREGENRTTVWKYDKPRKCDLHPTMKPVALVANAIKDGTKKGDVVLDLFGGSGTTLIACEQLGRKCRMMELDPHYCQVIIDRWEALTGEKAEKIA